MPIVSDPAALAPRTNGAATSPAATPPATTPRRDSLPCMTLVLPERNTFFVHANRTTDFGNAEHRQVSQRMAGTPSVLFSGRSLERFPIEWNRSRFHSNVL